jgi:hypothetical protein
VAAAHLNGDRRLDLAVANAGDGDISVLSGRRNGTFARTDYPAVDAGTVWVSVARFDGNRSADLAAANDGLDIVSVLLNE